MPDVPQTLMRHFIRGYVDGDGSLYWDTTQRRTPRINIVGGLSFLEKLAQVIHQETDVGIAKIITYKSKAPFLAYSGIKAQVLAKWLYIPSELMLERKGMLAHEFGSNDISNEGDSGMVGEHYPALAGGSQEQCMSHVFVLDTQKQPLTPVHPGRAR